MRDLMVNDERHAGDLKLLDRPYRDVQKADRDELLSPIREATISDLNDPKMISNRRAGRNSDNLKSITGSPKRTRNQWTTNKELVRHFKCFNHFHFEIPRIDENYFFIQPIVIAVSAAEILL
jgi:hypothetical protein